MAIRKPRSRSLVVRLTDDEYHTVATACERREGRSLSDFVRNVLVTSLENPQPPADANNRLRDLEQRVRELETAMAHKDPEVRKMYTTP